MQWICDITLPAVGQAVRQARGLVDALGLSLTAEFRDDLRLLLSEVMTNAVRHGSPDDPAVRPEVRVRVGVDGSRIRVEVHDSGPGFEHRPRGRRSELDSGWGVHFVDELAERWGTGHVGDHWVVWFELGLPPRPGQGAGMEYAQRIGVDGVRHQQDLGDSGDAGVAWTG